jgi:hypothetical protein
MITGATYAAFFTKDLRDWSSTRSSLFIVHLTRTLSYFSTGIQNQTESPKVGKRRLNVVEYYVRIASKCAAISVAISEAERPSHASQT